MNTHQILFSKPMVQSILDNTKTQTRRVITPQPNTQFRPDDRLHIYNRGNGKTNLWEIKDSLSACSLSTLDSFRCPFGKVGDNIWVKESFYAYGGWQKNGKTKSGRQKWKFHDYTGWDFEYKYFDNPPLRIQKGRNGLGWYKRSSLFMPQKASRIFLEITSIRIERLNNISDQDAIQEGIKQEKFIPTGKDCYYFYPCNDLRDDTYLDNPKTSFYSLWRSIHGKYSWEGNPWVWVIEFKRVEKPQNF